MTNLKSWSGIEGMFFITHGSTDTPVTSVSFATTGLDNFLKDALKLDDHELLARMEGFAIQGLKGTVLTFCTPVYAVYRNYIGTAGNYKKMVSTCRAENRAEILNQLCKLHIILLCPKCILHYER